MSITTSRKLVSVEWVKEEGTLAASRVARVAMLVMVVVRAAEDTMSIGWEAVLVSGLESPH